MNEQAIEHQSLDRDGSLFVHSIFKTIQGEGPFAGEPAVFVRLSGCNLQCPLCDTAYTGGKKMSVEEIVKAVYDLDLPGVMPLVVLTGGEPFRQNIVPLIKGLQEFAGHRVQIETNGTLYMPGPWDSVALVISPKTPKINEELANHACAFKYVAIAEDIDPEDGLPNGVLGQHYSSFKIARPPDGFDGPIFLQPADVKVEALNQKNTAAVVESCLRHGYQLCLQLHKIVGLE